MKFIQGKINWLKWKMVDATDFATPESHCSASTKIYMYGANNGASTAFSLVRSGTGSLTKDITHVGPSATGIYAICLTTSDLSGATVFYDHYIFQLSDTSNAAANQTIFVDGERTDTSRISNVLSYLSNMISAASDVRSDILVAANAAASRALLCQSYLSGMSDILSKVYVDTTDISDVLSNTHADLATMSGIVSDVYSLLSSRVTKAVATKSMVSGMSDILSKVYVDTTDISNVLSNTHADLADLSSISSNIYSQLIDAAEAGVSGISDMQAYLVSMSGMLSDTHSAAAAAAAAASTSAIADKVWSDFASKVGSSISDMMSTLAAGGGGATTSAIAAKVWSDFGSLAAMTPSDLGSKMGKLTSRITKPVATASMLTGMSDILSNVHGDVADLSNILSNTHADLATLSGVTSDIYSLLSSRVTKAVATKSMVSGMSDILSKVYADTTDISDVLSNVNARVPAALVGGKISAYVGASAWSVTGAAAAGCTTTDIISDTAGLDATDDHYNGRIMIFTSGNLKDQATDITDYDGGTTTFTVTALTEAPADDDTFVIL